MILRIAALACLPPHSTGVPGFFVSGVSIPMRRTVRRRPVAVRTLIVSPSTTLVTRADVLFAAATVGVVVGVGVGVTVGVGLGVGVGADTTGTAAPLGAAAIGAGLDSHAHPSPSRSRPSGSPV